MAFSSSIGTGSGTWYNAWYWNTVPGTAELYTHVYQQPGTVPGGLYFLPRNAHPAPVLRASERSQLAFLGRKYNPPGTYILYCINFIRLFPRHTVRYCIIIRMMLACCTLLARRTLLNQRAFCTVPTKPGSSIKVERGTDEAERAARDLVYGGQQPPPMPWAMMGFTAAVLGSYVAYHYLIELPREHALEALTEPVGPLPPQAHRRLPDGRLLMADGSIQSGDPSSTRQA